ncbi:YrpD family protein [Paenibacillus campi]|uniref:YrpD family protein n=1 Tax=Paenibacillus campi TaxID=3106031 RepID=UPI002AFE13A9|nr:MULTISPECIES: YrpD family protein [unclassified Paenibacillus]
MRKFMLLFMITFLLLQLFSLQSTEASSNDWNGTVTGNTYEQNNNLPSTFVKVTNSANVSNQDVNDFILKAQQIIKNEKQAQNPQISLFSQKTLTPKEVYDYFYIDESDKDLYFYEDGSNPIAKIVDLDTTVVGNTYINQNSSNTYMQSLAATSTISGGLGARVIIPSSGSLLEARIHTDGNVKQLDNNKGTTYTYVGFTGNTEADAGLQYSPLRTDGSGVQAWKPYLKVGGGSPWSTDTMLKGYDAVQYKNGYIPGEDVQVSFWKNYVHDNVSTTRLKLQGTAKCTNYTCTNTTPTKLAVIMEKNGTGVSNISGYKILATIADTSDSKAFGQLNTSINNITVDGISQVPKESARSSNSSMRVSSNSVTFNIR